jgi:hypothetical protein
MLTSRAGLYVMTYQHLFADSPQSCVIVIICVERVGHFYVFCTKIETNRRYRKILVFTFANILGAYANTSILRFQVFLNFVD